jgi:ligand-binding sensor domain-containing protein
LLNSTEPGAIHALLFASNGDVWMGSIHGGVIRRTSNGWKSYGNTQTVGLPNFELVPEMKSNEVRVISEAPDGTIWIGSDPGLVAYDPLMNRWSDEEPGPKDGEFGTMGVTFDYGNQTWVTGTEGTYAMSDHRQDVHWKGGLSIALGIKGGVFDQDVVIVGTDGEGLYIGKMASEAP